MKGLLSSLMVLVIAGLFLMSCTQPVQPSPATGPTPTVTEAPVSAARAEWEEKWNIALAEAKKEGSVALYSLWTSETKTSLTQAFKARYGIDLEFTAFGMGSQMAVKVQAESRAGLYLVDVFGVGSPTLFSYMKPQGILGPIKPLLVLPEVLDPNAWRGGEVPFVDKEGQILAMIGNTIRTVFYNTGLVKEGEITTYRDLLKPQFKGKITLLDPSVTGNSSFAHLGHNLWGEAETVNFLRRLIKDQEAVIVRDNRLHVESVARGKYAAGLGVNIEILSEFLRLGGPLKLAMVEEDNRVTPGPGTIAVPTRFAHPNATIVFVNWLLTKEGQSLFARSYGNPSTRLDASVEGIDPLFIPVAGKKYFAQTEDFLEATNKWLEIARKIIDESSK